MREIKLKKFRYSPGYSDMRGAQHETALIKNGDGVPVMVCRDREDHASPAVVTTYAVDPAAFSDFEAFIAKKNVPALALRAKSDLFATDHSPWSYYIEYDAVLFGKKTQKECTISEYRIYTPLDFKLLRELRVRGVEPESPLDGSFWLFRALHPCFASAKRRLQSTK